MTEEIVTISTVNVNENSKCKDNDKRNNVKICNKTLNYYDRWEKLFPELSILLLHVDIIKEELKNVPNWVPWPEDHFTTSSENNNDWTVFPFFHTFPATDPTKSKWINSTSNCCPRTVELLKQLPSLRTALFSKLGPKTKLSMHTGWEDLANYVLRCHISLKVPSTGSCGLMVNGEIRYHEEGDIIVFDDSKKHCAFNESYTEDRIVLIVDLMRPPHIPLGTAIGGHTAELDEFVNRFR
mmetsp:Transcript_17339/g.15639  ORF Transcript_17339/g.15639 Transcript_17339/m.15639 type:complete len:239 (+) Transcript_17339:103-819(+)